MWDVVDHLPHPGLCVFMHGISAQAAAENRAAVRQSIGYQKSQADVQAQLQELVRRLHATTIGVPSDLRAFVRGASLRYVL